MKLPLTRLHISPTWVLVNTMRLVLSGTFIFSGLVKMIDPTGVSYKVHNYMVAMGLGLSEGSLLPLIMAIGLSIAEFTLGLYLFFGIRRRWTSRILVLFMTAMTALTLWLVLTVSVWA